MKSATEFSLLIFGPLLIAFILPALFLFPAGLLLFLISIFDPTITAAESANYNAWVCGPVVAAAVLCWIGIWLHPYHQRSSNTVWVVIWAIFSFALFLASWFGVTLVTSIGASDYATGEFLIWTAKLAVGLTLILQPVVVFWLFISSRIIRGDMFT